MRRWAMVVAVPLALLTACARGGFGRESDGTDFDRRAAQTAEAWRASGAAAAWREDFVPLQDLTVLPRATHFTEKTKVAYASGWFRSTAPLSTKAPSGGSVRFPDGEAMSVPLVSAADAYRAIDKGDPPCGTDQCTALTITGVTLGTVQLRTSRGTATVPAWLFTVDEIAEPVARVAVAGSAVTAPPSGGPLIAGLDSYTVDGARLTYSIIVGCVEEVTPRVYEAEDVVVVGATSAPVRGGVCDDVARFKKLTVTLKAPLGDRIVLNSSGQPLRGTTSIG